MTLTADGLDFLDFIAHSFIVSTEELAHRDDDVDLRGAIGQCQGCLGHLHLGKGLR